MCFMCEWCGLVGEHRKTCHAYTKPEPASRKSVIQPVPQAERIDVNVSEGQFVLSEGYNVAGFSPGKVEENLPMTEVHLLLPFALPGVGRGQVALRMKSTRALDELVAVLLQHRADVWGKP